MRKDSEIKIFYLINKASFYFLYHRFTVYATQQNERQTNGNTTAKGEEEKAPGTNGASVNGTEDQTVTKEITVRDVISKTLAQTDFDKSSKRA